MFNLSDDERRRFAGWLYVQSDSDRTLADQMEKIGEERGAKLYRMKAAAKKLVADELDTTETVVVGKE